MTHLLEIWPTAGTPAVRHTLAPPLAHSAASTELLHALARYVLISGRSVLAGAGQALVCSWYWPGTVRRCLHRRRLLTCKLRLRWSRLSSAAAWQTICGRLKRGLGLLGVAGVQHLKSACEVQKLSTYV
jgi:hypothetical protein